MLVGPRAPAGTLDKLVHLLSAQDDAAARNAAADALELAGAVSVGPLISALEAGDSDQRKFIVDTLGKLGDSAACPTLIEILSDPDPNLRASAAESLGYLPTPAGEAALIARLDKEELLVQHSILDALLRMKANVPLSILARLQKERLLARPVLKLLAKLADEAAVEQIIAALEDPSRGTRNVAVISMAQWRRRHGQSREAILAKLSNRDPDSLLRVCKEALDSTELSSRSAGLDLVAVIGRGEALADVLQAAEDERLEQAAQEALMSMGTEIAEPLLGFVDGISPAARRVVLSALARIGDDRAVGPLLALLESGDIGAQREAALALGELGDARAIEALASLVGRPERSVARAAIEALSRLAETERESVLEICRARLDGSNSDRTADVCELLGEVGGLAELPLLEVALPHADPRVRAAALSAIARISGLEALEALKRALMDEDAGVRSAAVEGLQRLGGGEAFQSLLGLSRDEAPQVVAAAFRALGGWTADLEQDARSRLERILLDGIGRGGESRDPLIALASIEALCRLDAPCLPEALERAASHPEAEVVKEAVSRCADADFPEAVGLLCFCAAHSAWDVRRAAAVALAARADPSSLDALQSLLSKEEDNMVAGTLESAIKIIEARRG